jgi:hypothetical protein
MPDRLYDAIVAALTKPLDDVAFERCAIELLSPTYPGLVAVEGGNDAGMDGRGELPNGERFILITTTGKDARANLDRNIDSYLNAGGDRRSVVFATSRSISGRRQLELVRHLHQTWKVRLIDVHDRSTFAPLLYRNARWRRDLLGVAGDARALARVPGTRRPTPVVKPVGREQDLERLRHLSGDLLLTGKPGIGKTFVVERLMDEDWGLFDDGWDIAVLEDAIRDLAPARVVVDDAHLAPERIAKLRQLRREMDAKFAIVAVSWPGQKDPVASFLPDSTHYEIRELDRDQIVELIAEVGVHGPRHLQMLIVDQAQGRAGLAVTLAYACLRGRSRDVATGDALVRDLVDWYVRTIMPESRHVLGVLSLAGLRGASLGQVASALGLPAT